MSHCLQQVWKMFGLVIVILFVKVSFGEEHCKEWISTADGQFRSHCYWYHTVSTKISAFVANEECALTGDGLAPYIDDEQYQFILDIRLSGCPASFIGVMDVGQENIWTHLDGTEIANNGFISTFDILSSFTDQPNGGTNQNCAIINDCAYTYNRYTQDKECHSYVTDGMICYRNTLGTKNCLTWISNTDGKRRTHCYWVATRYPSMSSFTVTKAMEMCRRQGGTIAPIIDDEQFQFIKNITDYYEIFATGALIWTGMHNRGDRGQNWNRDPCNVSTGLISPTSPSSIEERCLIIMESGVSWRICTDTFVQAVVCYKTPTTLFVPSNITMKDILQEITVDPTQTNAYRLSKISVYDDRPSAKAIGYVGIILIAAPILFLIMLDCQRLDNLRKPKRKKKNDSLATENRNTTDNSGQVNQQL